MEASASFLVCGGILTGMRCQVKPKLSLSRVIRGLWPESGNAVNHCDTKPNDESVRWGKAWLYRGSTSSAKCLPKRFVQSIRPGIRPANDIYPLGAMFEHLFRYPFIPPRAKK